MAHQNVEHSNEKKLYTPFRIVSFVVLLLMASAIVYASGISIYYWSGIGV